MRRTETDNPSTAGRWFPAWVGAAAVVAVLLVVGAALAEGGESYRSLGLSHPGTLTTLGTGLLRAAFDVAAALCVGFLLCALFFTDSDPAGRLSAPSWAAVRRAGWSARVWCVASLALVPFEAADSIGVPVSRVLSPGRLVTAVVSLYEPAWWLASALVALAIALGCHVVLRWRAALGLLGAAVVGLMPPVVAGHAASGIGHDITMATLMVHVVAAAAWLGTLAALLVALRRRGERGAVQLTRYPRFAGVCWVVLAASGVVTALYLVPASQLLTTGYGLAVLGKLAALGLVGLLGVAARRPGRSGPACAAGRLVRLACVDLALLVITVGLTMSLTRSVPPAYFAEEPTPIEIALGYPLPGPPSLLNLIGTWRIDVLLLLFALLGVGLYLRGAARLRGRGEHWPPGRTVAWIIGWLLVVVASSSGIGAYAAASLPLHMASHMMLNTAAPLLLVLGGPVTLALRAMTPAAANAPAGPREWLLAATTSRAARLLSHPVLAVALFTGSYYLLYFTGLFEAAMGEHWSRMALNVAVLLIGYQMFWILVGVDDRRRRPPHLARLGLAFAVMPFHAVFSVILISLPTVIAQNYYRTLQLPWGIDLLAAQTTAGVISLVIGEVALIAAQIVLLQQWQRHDGMAGFGRAGGPGDEDAAFAAMLDTLRASRPR